MSKPLCAWCLNEYSEDPFCCEKMDYENTKIKLAEATKFIQDVANHDFELADMCKYKVHEKANEVLTKLKEKRR